MAEDTRMVVATGIGIDRDAAIKQGLRGAVEQAIGVFLKSESVVENFELIDDKILSHSRGYVESYDILKEGPDAGLYGVTLKAVVIVRELESALIELELYSRPVEGETLFAKAFTRISEAKDALSLYQDLRDQYPRNCIRVVFGEPDIETSASDEVEISIPFSLEWKNEYLTQLREVLEETSEAIANTREEEEALKQEYGYPHAPVYLVNNRPGETGQTVYFVRDVFADVLAKKYGKQRLYVSLEDAEGNVIASKKVPVSTRLFHVWSDQGNFVGGRTVRIRGIYYEMIEQGERAVKFTLALEELGKVATVTGYFYEDR